MIMATEIVKIDPKDFGLEEQKAAQIEAQFKPMLEKMTALETEFNEIINLPIEKPETAVKAKELRLKYVKVRMGTADIHKQQKVFYLAGGRFVDGWKNAQEFASLGKENELTNIEKYAENQEKERIAVIDAERTLLLEGLTEVMPMGLGTMQQEVFDNYLNGLKVAHAARIEAERKAESDRIAAEKADREERERTRNENERLKKEAELKEKQLLYERQQAEKQAEKAEAESKRIAAENEARLSSERAVAEKKLQAEREASAKLQAELKTKQDAESKRIAAENEEKRQRVEAERKAALAPDKEKILAWINSMDVPVVIVSTDRAKMVIIEIEAKFKSFKNWAVQQANTI